MSEPVRKFAWVPDPPEPEPEKPQMKTTLTNLASSLSTAYAETVFKVGAWPWPEKVKTRL